MLSKNTNIPLLGLLTSIAIIISMLEQFITLDFVLVGAKLGLANIVTVFVIIKFGQQQAFLLLFTRIITVALLTGRISSLLFSFLGGFFAFFISYILIKYYKNNVTFVGICIAGSAFHHIGQVLAGIIMFSTPAVIAYLPWLLLVSIPTGFLTGTFLEVIIPRLDKIA